MGLQKWEDSHCFSSKILKNGCDLCCFLQCKWGPGPLALPLNLPLERNTIVGSHL